MLIYVKPIKIKENEWQPQQFRFFNARKLKKIIIDEKLDQDMLAIDNVIFDAKTQVISNIIIDPCDRDLDSYIYYIKTDIGQIFNKEYCWGYVSSRSIRANTEINLSITIDLIASSLDYFNRKQLIGEHYIERTNNYNRSINDIHSEDCGNIENKTSELIELPIKINRKIDTFIERDLFTFNKRMHIVDNTDVYNLEFQKKGTLVVIDNDDQTQSMTSYSTLQNISILMPNFTDKNIVPDNIVSNILDKYASYVGQYDNDDWYFLTYEDVVNFSDELKTLNPEDNGLLHSIDKIITDSNTRSWLSIPKIFDIDDEIISFFEIDLSSIKLDLKNHINIHNKYFISVHDLFKIPIDIIKVKDKIYGKRIVTTNSVKFSFFYDKNTTDNFYSLSVDNSNGLTSQQYRDYLNQLNISYGSGLKSVIPTLSGVVNSLVGIAVGGVIGKDFVRFGLLKAISGLPFRIYSSIQNSKYNDLKEPSVKSSSDNILMSEVLSKLLFTKSYIVEWAYFRRIFGSSPMTVGYANTRYSQININEIKNLFLYKETMINDDILLIENDQYLHGNIVNGLFINNRNILEFNTLIDDFLFFQGRINPEKPVINQFQLELLNIILATGVTILNYKIQGKVTIISSTKDFIISKNEFLATEIVSFNSTNNDLSISNKEPNVFNNMKLTSTKDDISIIEI